MEAEINIETIGHHSPHLEAVIALGRANAKTLGRVLEPLARVDVPVSLRQSIGFGRA